MPRKQQRSLLSILIIVTLAASTVITLTEFGSMISAQAQVNASTVTPAQKDAICNPNNPSSKLNPVNTTESRICGIPVTVKPSNATTTSTGTTGGEAPPSSTSTSTSPPPATSIAPSATPP